MYYRNVILDYLVNYSIVALVLLEIGTQNNYNHDITYIHFCTGALDL